MTSDTMTFIGKWAFSSTDGNSYISLDKNTGLLTVVATQSAQEDQRFNAYGDTGSGFWLQASNGKYVIYNGNGYAATDPRTGTPSLFVLETSDSSVRLGEQAAGTKYYVNMNGDAVNRVPIESPPSTTLLEQLSISPGLVQIQASKVAESMDLTWVYMAAADLSSIIFSGSDLSHADLSNCNVYGAIFQGLDTNLSYASFANASMSYVMMAEVIMSNADLTNAIMTYAQLPNSNLQGSIFAGANLTDASLINADLKGADLTNANLYGANANGTHFDQANLTKTNFLRAVVINVHIPGATVAYANLDNQDLTTAEIDSLTNFTGASMQNVRLSNCSLLGVTFSHADLTGSLFDGANLTGADFSYANLTNASLKNGVKLYSSSMSNATLTSADLTGAQLGAKDEAFTLSTSLVPDLNSGAITSSIQQAFQEAGHPLSNNAMLTVRIPDQNWVITDGNTVYTITNGGAVLNVWTYSDTNDAAVLAGAYMPNAIFTDANLYAVNMSGVNWYGDAAKANNADLEEADLAGANLGSMDFSQARMYGCNLDSANLVSTNFNGVYLRASINKKQASLAYANLQGATFVEAQLQGAVLTNAAISLDQGPFFTLPSSYASSLNNQTISSDLRTQFEMNNYPLESNATVTVNILGSYWTINNGSNSVYPVYNIVEIGTTLYVSGGPIGVHLFDLPQSMSNELDQQNVAPDIQTAFSDNGYPLLPTAVIDQVIVQGSEWHMSNINADTTQLQEGYAEFYILKNTEDETLHVYGSVLMVVRIGDDQTLQQVRIALATTQVTQDVMDGTTTCPNGQKLSQYLNQTPPQHITWEQMMTAATPPKPPACIPDPWHWCP
ncbi:pentapeptide repeat-containing protein [Paenibacillus sp. ACRRX]|uniref:pentapeptide repeat-containing protein n=1 Tax=Paenibacillus sp. ACRRX TaxID=2918206 RepID=UPI001EF58655|nr:pentapeptide repeat-containing protein [Paenibacillus sp. ACRRX]MCG7409290.1 pentapeptide repeat-containing protein [Paenibacillus sp. ACRRX]